MLEILDFEFMQNAFLAGLLISIASGIIGSLIIINRMSFIAGGIAHGSYGGIGLALFFGISPLLGALGFAIFLAVIFAFLGLKNKNRTDSLIGAIWAFGMAIGIIFTDLTPGYNTDLMSYLFGSIMSVPKSDIYALVGADILFIAFILTFYKQILTLSFDTEFGALRGLNIKFLYYLMIIFVAIAVIASVQIVGLILVIALLTIPPFIAEKFSSNLFLMMINSSIISAVFCILGLGASYYLNLTSGAAIILIATLAFFATNIILSLKKDNL